MKSTTVKNLVEKNESVELQQKLEADRKKRADAMKEYLEVGLKKFNCDLEVAIQISASGNRPLINIKAL